jgi:hypothetical protein
MNPAGEASKAYIHGKGELAKGKSGATDLTQRTRRIPELFPPGTGGPRLDRDYAAKPAAWAIGTSFSTRKKSAAGKTDALPWLSAATTRRHTPNITRIGRSASGVGGLPISNGPCGGVLRLRLALFAGFSVRFYDRLSDQDVVDPKAFLGHRTGRRAGQPRQPWSQPLGGSGESGD